MDKFLGIDFTEHITDLALRMWCIEQNRNKLGFVNMKKAKETYEFISAHSGGVREYQK